MKTLIQSNPGEEKIIPGTLFAITPKQSSAIELAVILGKKLQELFPEIANDYRGGDSASQIVKKHNLVKILGYNYKVVMAAVYRAIGGYDGLIQIFDIYPYDGLIKDQDEIKKLAESHNEESGRIVGNDMFKRKIGIFALTKKERYEASCSGAIGRGMIPYSKKEFAFIKKLAKDPSYLMGKLLNVKKIASEVNEKFHSGAAVRLSKSITKLLFRKKIREAIQFIHSKEELTFIGELVNNPKYQKGKNSLLKEICKEVNVKFHNSKEIRTPNGINKVISRKKLKMNFQNDTEKVSKKCKNCNDTGVIETGNNDLPCDCKMGDKALFNSAWVGGGPITGKVMKRHFLNNSPEPIRKVIHISELPK